MSDLSAGIGKVCNNSQGGMSVFYPFNGLDSAFTVISGVATAMNASLTEAFKYVISGDNNTYTDEEISDKKTGNTVVNQTIAFELKQIDAVKGAQLTSLIQCDAQGVYKSKAGKYFWIGHENGINVTAKATALSGGGANDFNGYQVELVSENRTKAPELDSATVTAFLAIVA